MKVIVRLPATLSGVTARRKIARQLRGNLETPRAERAPVPPQNTKCFGDPAWPAIEAATAATSGPGSPQALLVGWRAGVPHELRSWGGRAEAMAGAPLKRNEGARGLPRCDEPDW